MNNAIPIAATIVLFAINSAAFAARRGPTPPEPDRFSNAFASDLYEQLAKSEGNLFFSPTSIQTALAMAWAGANGRTADEMAKALRLAPDAGPDSHARLGSFLNQLNADGKAGGYELSTANALWLLKDYSFAPGYLAFLKKHYDADPSRLDFINDAPGSRKMINDWVAAQTHDRIKDLMPPGSIDRDTRLVLTNAIYFKGKWDRPFDKTLTVDSDFRNASGKKVKVPMMFQRSQFRYGEDNAVQVLELPYGNDEICMRIFLPRQVSGLPALEGRLTSRRLAGLGGKLQPEDVKLWLPRFTMECDIQLNETMRTMGMNLAFDRRLADFSAMSPSGPLYISTVIHKAFVKVDEEGTEAAAATGVGVALGVASAPPPPPKEFHADHPFFFAIIHRKTDAMLFMGRLAMP